MTILVIFAFIAGFVTILSPCILPLLPIILTGSLGESRKRPLGIITGFVLSFTFFTLFITTIVRSLGIPADTLRNFSVLILILLGLALFSPQFQLAVEKLFSKLSPKLTKGQNLEPGFLNGFLVGLSLGLAWTPCVGPIIASVITLAATAEVSSAAFLITFSFAVGTAIPMFGIAVGGQKLLNSVSWLTKNTEKIQKAFGVLIILTAIGIYFGIDREFQTYILETFPNYSETLTQFERNDMVKEKIDMLLRR